MARTLNKLTAVKVRNLKTDGMHSDGGGLYLRVQADGRSRSWVMLSTKGGKRTQRSIGLVDGPGALSLAQAREVRDAPPAATIAEAPLFGEWATDFITNIESGFKSAVHREQWRQTIRDYAKAVAPAATRITRRS